MKNEKVSLTFLFVVSLTSLEISFDSGILAPHSVSSAGTTVAVVAVLRVAGFIQVVAVALTYG